MRLFYKTVLLTSAFVCNTLTAQIGVGTVNPEPSSILDVESTTKGFLPPRVASHGDVTDPAEGLIIYDISDNCLNVWNDSEWINLCDNNDGDSGSAGENTGSSIVSDGIEMDCGIQNVKSYGSAGLASEVGNHITTEGQNPSLWRYNRYILSDDGKIYDTWGRQYDTTAYVKQYGPSYSTRPSRLINLDDQLGSEKIEQMIVSLGVAHGGFINYYDVIVFRTDAGKIYSLRMEAGGGGTSFNGPSIRDRFNRPIIGPESRVDIMGLSTDYQNKYTLYPLTGVSGANWTKLLPSSAVLLGVSASHNSGDRMFAFNSTDNKWYSWGGYVHSNYIAPRSYHSAHTLGNKQLLLRDVADITNSVTPNPATILNKVLIDNSTSLYDPENLDYATSGLLFFKQNSKIYNFFLTNDGILNVIQPDGNYQRYKIEGTTPGSIDPIIQVSYADNFNSGSGTGPIATSYNHLLLTESGNIYEISLRNLPVFTSQDNTPIDLITPANASAYIAEHTYDVADLDNVKFKYILDPSLGTKTYPLIGISDDGIIYSIKSDPNATAPLLGSGIFANAAVTGVTPYSGYKNSTIPKVDKLIAYGGSTYKTLIFSEKGTGQIWEYGYGINSYLSSATGTGFDRNLPHQNMTNHLASKTTGLNLDSTTTIPLYKHINCAQSYGVESSGSGSGGVGTTGTGVVTGSTPTVSPFDFGGTELRFKSFDISPSSTLGVDTDGRAFEWGNNSNSTIDDFNGAGLAGTQTRGISTTANSPFIMDHAGFTGKVEQYEASLNTRVVLTTDGKVYAFNEPFGMAASPTYVHYSIPVEIPLPIGPTTTDNPVANTKFIDVEPFGYIQKAYMVLTDAGRLYWSGQTRNSSNNVITGNLNEIPVPLGEDPATFRYIEIMDNTEEYVPYVFLKGNNQEIYFHGFTTSPASIHIRGNVASEGVTLTSGNIVDPKLITKVDFPSGHADIIKITTEDNADRALALDANGKVWAWGRLARIHVTIGHYDNIPLVPSATFTEAGGVRWTSIPQEVLLPTGVTKIIDISTNVDSGNRHLFMIAEDHTVFFTSYDVGSSSTESVFRYYGNPIVNFVKFENIPSSYGATKLICNDELIIFNTVNNELFWLGINNSYQAGGDLSPSDIHPIGGLPTPMLKGEYDSERSEPLTTPN